MKPPAFEYVKVTTVDGAIDALTAYGGDAKLLAGGQSLVPMLNFRLLSPKALIDINSIAALDGLEARPDGGLRIGALTRHYDLMTSLAVRRHVPVLAEAMSHVAHVAIRNRGSIGGSLSHADPSAELPMMAVLLEGTLRLIGPSGSRELPASEFFRGALSTALASDEVLTEIMLPPAIGRGWGFREFARRAGDFALAAAAAIMSVADGRVCEVRLAVTGVGETPLRIHRAEALLQGRALDADALKDVSGALQTAIEPPDDLHASSAYRRHLVGGLVGKVLEDAWRRAREARVN